MGLFSAMTAPFRTKADAGVPAQGFLPALGGVPSATGLTVSQATAMGVSAVNAAVMQRASDVARCTPRLMQEGGPRGGKPITDHPVAKLLRRPNVIQTWFEWAVQMHVAYLLRGNAYAVILRDGKGDPVALIPINPDAVLVLEATDGQIFYQVNRIGLFMIDALRGHPVAIPSEDVLHVRSLTFGMFVGLSTIGAARDSIGLAMGLEQQSARFMANGARPSGVLQTAKTISVDAAKRLREQWDGLRSGIQNVGRTAILEEGLEWKPMQMNSVDLEFMAQRTFSIADVARFFRVPLYKIGGELPRGLKVGEMDQAYVNSTIMPDLDMWEQKFDQAFSLSEEGLAADFDERRLLRADEATRINNYRLQVMSGLKTQNECRALEGDPPMEGGNVLLRPVNLASSGSDMSGTAPDGAGRPPDGQLPDPGAANKTEVVEYVVEHQPQHVRDALGGKREGEDEA
jgi:HK97 family phage portal protein